MGGVFFPSDEDVLELDSGCTTLTVLNATELYTL